MFVGDFKAIAPARQMGPWPTFVKSNSIIGRSVVSATVVKANQVLLLTPAQINSTSTVSAVITGNRAVIPAVINSTSTVTAAISGGTQLIDHIDFVPIPHTAPALTIPFTIGPGVKPGNFGFTPLRED
jgi:hypothetical protein